MILSEQVKLSVEQVEELALQDTYEPQKLGISRDADGFWWTSYYIGADVINGKPVEILPKLENIDFMSLFSYAIMYQPSADYFANYYEIYWDRETIISSRLYDVLTPLLVVQYLNILKQLVGRGLKRDYVAVEENLKSKIKGRILPIKQFRKNTINKRDNFFYCRHQEFSANIPVNKILKKALEISISLLGDMRSKSTNLKSNTLLSSELQIIDCFRNIDSDVNIQSVKESKFDKLNAFYPEAIKLAKMLIKHKENSIAKGGSQKKVPPFKIDMSCIFEVYVLGILESNYPQQIKFQVDGSYYTMCDYVHKGEGIIIDAKYKQWYSSKYGRDKHYHYLLADIREVSGYARDSNILKHFDDSMRSNPPCLIIHPGTVMPEFENRLLNECRNNPIDGFNNFYHLGIPLPLLQYKEW